MDGINYSVYRKSTPPCRDCEARAVGCHATCEHYAEWKAGENAERSKALKDAIEAAPYNSYVRKEKSKRIARANR